MADEIATQVDQLRTRANAFSTNHGASVVKKFEAESALFVQWLNYLGTSQRTNVADSLLVAAASSVREAAACLSLGLVRPALFSLRTQIDLVLGWLYFKDHPVEWKTVNDLGSSFKLKREILEYLGEHYAGFTTRAVALKEVSTRNADDPYRLLSAHIHAQSTPSLPTAMNLIDVVHAEALCNECTALAREVAEYLNDLLVAVFGSKWNALPSDVKKSVDQRLDGKKASKEKFYATI